MFLTHAKNIFLTVKSIFAGASFFTFAQAWTFPRHHQEVVEAVFKAAFVGGAVSNAVVQSLGGLLDALFVEAVVRLRRAAGTNAVRASFTSIRAIGETWAGVITS